MSDDYAIEKALLRAALPPGDRLATVHRRCFWHQYIYGINGGYRLAVTLSRSGDWYLEGEIGTRGPMEFGTLLARLRDNDYRQLIGLPAPLVLPDSN